jgi:hypothetical protein
MTLPNQKLIKFGPDYALSIVDEEHGHNKYELAVIYKEELIHMPGISDEGDTVTRFRSAQDVQAIMKKMFSITGVMPEKG